MLITYLHVVPRLIMSVTTRLLHLIPSWHGQGQIYLLLLFTFLRKQLRLHNILSSKSGVAEDSSLMKCYTVHPINSYGHYILQVKFGL